MAENKKAPAPMRYGESVFDILYLLFDLVAGIVFLLHGKDKSTFCLWGVLALTLGVGDAFHLLPRVEMHLRGANEKTQKKLGLGMGVTSVTMTVFYLVLYGIWRSIFVDIFLPIWVVVLLFVSLTARIIICLFPQNKWLSGGDIKWSYLRNIPFFVTGVIMIVLFAITKGCENFGLWKISIAVFLSFGFYFPVAFGAKKKPMLGALMLPKTVMYIWMLAMGLQLIGKI